MKILNYPQKSNTLKDCLNNEAVRPQQRGIDSRLTMTQVYNSQSTQHQEYFIKVNKNRSKYFNVQHNFKMLVQLLSLICLMPLVSCNNIYMTAVSTNQFVASTSTYTLAFDRTLNTLGQSITPATLSSTYTISVIFDASYNISSTISVIPNNYTVNTNTQTVTLQLSQPISVITISSIQNPLPSSTPLRITLNFYNSSSSTAIVDTCSATLTFKALTLASSSISYQFNPGNVSTFSNLTLAFIPFTWSSQLSVSLNFFTYWVRNMLNVSSNQVLNSMSYCKPTCVINNMGNFFLLQFTTSLTLTNNSISITIYNILSPASLQPADTITISMIEATYSTNVQTGTLSISATYPNNLQVITPTTTTIIGNPVTLTLTITTQDLFSSSDSIRIVMNTPVAMASQVTVGNILVASSSISVQQNSIITINNFILVTNIPGQFSGTITISNISSQASVKPVVGNVISFYRNGYLYDQSEFTFNVNQASVSSIGLSLSSNQANANSSLTISVAFSYGLVKSDLLYMSIDQAITVYSCNVLSCSTCVCTITVANPSQGIFSNSLKITSFGSTTASLNIILSIKNPISSNYVLYLTATDSSNYTKQTGNQTFPNITESAISSAVFTLTTTSNIVYQPTNFTIVLNFSTYTLLNGWLTITFDAAITLLDSASRFCLVNGNNGGCTLSLVNSTIIMANISVSSQTQLYTVVINNLRNPLSTKFYNFQVSILNSNNLAYYSLVSTNYQVTTPYQLTPQTSSSNCTNSASNSILITFPFLPFLPANATVIDDPSAKSILGESKLKKLIYPVTFTSNFSITISNQYSLQPYYFQVLVVTNDLLYTIYAFNFTVTNCNPSFLPIISYSFTGLPQNQGTLTFVINQIQIQSGSASINGINYITVLFSSEYPSNITISSNAQLTTIISPRFFNLSIGNTQPITVSIWGFTNVIGNYISIQAFTFSQANSYISYLVSSNANTVKYNLTAITNCTFPCKICSSTNSSACLQCYSINTTQLYFLDAAAQKCVSPSSCSSPTFPNYTLSTCSLCPTQCSTCTSFTVCQSCASNYYLLNGSCLTTCPSGYYPINIQQICSPCDSVNNTAHCETCITINLCSTCLYPYYLDPSTKTCVVSCASNQIPLNRTCFSCNVYCSTCSSTTSNCTSCISSYYFLLNACLPSCPSPYVPSTTTNICVNCSTVCLLCVNNPTTCTSCQYPLKLFNSSCINDCPVSYYTYTANNSTLQCLTCLTQCYTCTSLSICTSCISGYFFYQNSCLLSCPISTYNRTITSSNVVSLICQACSSNCLTCTGTNTCSQCSYGYYLSYSTNQSFCVSVCSSGQYLSGNTCQKCTSNCITCLNSSICLVCTTSYSLQNSVCVSNCSIGFVSILKTVVIPSNTTAYVCQACSQRYQYCITCLTTNCTGCTSGYILNHDQTCVVICPNGYVNISSVCVGCSPQCQACSVTQNNCSSCSQGYVFYQNASSSLNRCLLNCVSGTFNLSGVCTSCSSPCLTCVNSSSSCLSCVSGFYSLVISGILNCVASCPSNSYIFNTQCIYCNSTCSICDGNGCLSCYPQYYTSLGSIIANKSYYNCYSSCPASLPYLINNTCSKCRSDCLICNSTSCLQCTTGTYGYNQYCLQQCPPGMVASSGICIVPSNSTNATNTVTPTASTQTIIPIPFTISSCIIIATIFISKLSHPNTSVTIAIFSIISFLAIICNIFYLIKSLTSSQTSAYLAILIVGLAMNYINNIIFLFMSKYTLLRDKQFSCWKRGNVQLIRQLPLKNQPSHLNLQDHLNSEDNSEPNDTQVPSKLYTYQCIWYLLLTTGFFTSHNAYTIVFSQLFDLSIFKAAVSSVKTFKFINYLWVVAIIAHLICSISGIIVAASWQASDHGYIQHIYQAIDLIALNSICVILGLLLLRKKRQLWQREKAKSVGEDNNSTKKVIFDHQSHQIDMNKEIENQSEVNGRIKNLLGTQNGGSEQQIVGASYKSSTNQEVSDLYFEKQGGQNLDDSQDIKLDNNIIWMQINPNEMEPQLIEKDQSLFEQSVNIPNASQFKEQGKQTLQPDNNLEDLDFNNIYPEEQQSQHSSQPEQQKQKQFQVQEELAHQQENIVPIQQEEQNKEAGQQEWQMDEQQGEQQIAQDQLEHNKQKQQSQQQEIEVIDTSKPNEYLRKEDDKKQKAMPQTHKPYNFIRIEYNHQSNIEDIPQIQYDYSKKQPNHSHLIQIQKVTSNKKLQKSMSNKTKVSNKLFQSKESLNKKQVKKMNEGQKREKITKQEKKVQVVASNESLQHAEDDQLIKFEKENTVKQKQEPIAILQTEQITSIDKNDLIRFFQDQYENQQFLQPQTKQVVKQDETTSKMRQVKTEHGTRSRKRQNKTRYAAKEQLKPKQEANPQISGVYQLFNQYHSQSSPKMHPKELEQILSKQSLSVHGDSARMERISEKHDKSVSQKQHQNKQSQRNSPKLSDQFALKIQSNRKSPQLAKQHKSPKHNQNRYSKYSKYDPIKQEQPHELRLSSSAHNFQHQKQQQKQTIQEFITPVLNEDSHEHSYFQNNYRTLPQKQQTSESQLKKSIYKSINIAKINNRLGQGAQQPAHIKTKSKDNYASHSGLKDRGKVRNNLSLSKMESSSSLSQYEKNHMWKSRVTVNNPKQGENGTAKIIQKKSKLAQVKAKLQSIYLPTK